MNLGAREACSVSSWRPARSLLREGRADGIRRWSVRLQRGTHAACGWVALRGTDGRGKLAYYVARMPPLN